MGQTETSSGVFQDQRSIQQLLAELAGKRVILCLGPGGVGKTTFSAALAMRLAKAGKRTLVCTLDPARRLAQALGMNERHAQPGPVPRQALSQAGLPRDLPLQAAVLDVAATMDRALAQECRDKSLQQAIQSNIFYRMLVEDLEGAQMYAALAQLEDMADQDQWDHIVVDTPPTVHLHDLLVAPYRITHAVHSPFLRWLASSQTWTGRTGLAILALGRARLLRKAAAVVGGRFLEQLSQFIGLISDLLPILEQRAERAERLLKDRDTGYVVITIPNQDRVDETVRLAEELRSQDMILAGLVVNRISPFAHQGAIEALRATLRRAEDGNDRDPGETRPGCLQRLIAFAQSMGRSERQAISQLRARLPAVPLIELPLLPEDLTGLSEVAQVTQLLETGPNHEPAGNGSHEAMV